ncbi:MAG TPA: M48 family metalloprotease [Anaeromyxobacter sp.]|nr:M48 family metalloprotease [Anaeromyxobacter sp.]
MTPATLDAVRQVLPAWTIWLPLAAPLAALPIAYGLASLGVLVAGSGLRRLPPDAHWTERARHVSTLRRTILLMTPLPVLATVPFAVGGPVSMGRGLVLPTVLAVALACVVAVAFRAENRWVRRIPAGARVRSFLALLLVACAGLVAPLVLLALRPFAPQVGLGAWLLSLVAVSAVFTFGGGLLLARLVGLVRAPPARLVEALVRALPPGVRPPRVRVVRVLSANAFAIPWSRTILVTEGALEHLDDDGLAAVLAHELEHLREPLAVRALRPLFGVASGLVFPVAISVAVAPELVARPPLGLVAALAVALAYLAAAFFYQRLLLRMEARSDAAAHAASPAYATALDTIYRVNLAPAVQGRKTSHPDLVERFAEAGVSPPWPVPPPPPSPWPAVATVAFCTFVLAAGLLVARLVAARSARDERGCLVAVALEGRANDLANLAIVRFTRGAPAEAAPLFRAAAELRPADARWPAWEAMSLATAGKCQEASAALTAAAALAQGNLGYTAGAQAALASCTPR